VHPRYLLTLLNRAVLDKNLGDAMRYCSLMNRGQHLVPSPLLAQFVRLVWEERRVEQLINEIAAGEFCSCEPINTFLEQATKAGSLTPPPPPPPPPSAGDQEHQNGHQNGLSPPQTPHSQPPPPPPIPPLPTIPGLEGVDLTLVSRMDQTSRKGGIPLLYSAYDALIKSYAQTGNPQAIELFEEMQRQGFRISEATCAAVLGRCAESQYLQFAEKIVSYYRGHNQGKLTPQIYTVLVQVYAAAGLFDRACDTYDQIKKEGMEPTSEMLQSLTKFAIECGRIEFTKALFKKCQPDISSYMNLIRVCGRERNVSEALGVLASLERDPNVEADAGAYNSVLDVCLTHKDRDQAEKLFDRMKRGGKVDIVSYNTMLKGYAGMCQLEAAERMLEAMQGDGYTPDEVSYNSIINAAVSSGNVDKAWAWIDYMKHNNIQVDRYTCSIMIKNLRPTSSRDDVGRTLQLMDNIDVCQDTVLFSTIVDACARLKDTRRLTIALDQFKQSGLRPNVHAYGTLIKAYGRCKRLDEAWALWREMTTERKLEPNNYTFGCMFDTLVSNQCVEQAMDLFQKLVGSGVTPNTVQYSILIKGFAQNKQIDKALQLYRDMQEKGVPCNEVTYNTLIHACTSVSDMRQAVDILEDMNASREHPPDLITYSTMIKGFCAQGNLEAGLELFESMRGRGIQPDTIVYNTLLEGCARRYNLQMTEQLLEDMIQSGVAPTSFTLTILVKLYGRAKQLDKALSLVTELPRRFSFELDAYVYTALMAACIANQRLPLAIEVFETMLRKGLRPNARTFGTIIVGCLKGGSAQPSFLRHNTPDGDSPSSPGGGGVANPKDSYATNPNDSHKYMMKAIEFAESAINDGLRLEASVLEACIKAIMELPHDQQEEFGGQMLVDKLTYAAAQSAAFPSPDMDSRRRHHSGSPDRHTNGRGGGAGNPWQHNTMPGFGSRLRPQGPTNMFDSTGMHDQAAMGFDSYGGPQHPGNTGFGSLWGGGRGRGLHQQMMDPQQMMGGPSPAIVMRGRGGGPFQHISNGGGPRPQPGRFGGFGIADGGGGGYGGGGYDMGMGNGYGCFQGQAHAPMVDMASWGNEYYGGHADNSWAMMGGGGFDQWSNTCPMQQDNTAGAAVGGNLSAQDMRRRRF